ncbi:HAD family hydrolase [Spirilliplanes yamanashiensis]|uniref:Hydrolase n=1 Tax=Spirilliplanes yamanashiensis TaxID=42233 RepID=A0A8J4DIA8_9ACTN|nr:HAD family hydrolase [Spirilliplanes yamanashiensis]MDP9814522.1 putative hydrolase of the HAD superfamily [Spirilliplanes yamanashiensis]GIJ02174.1 hydrolase [Spirilliplanes yamanashiensis]
MIRAVVFDADHTLVDLRPAVEAAQDAVLAEAHARGATGLSAEEMRADWYTAFAAMAAEPVQRIRRAALAASLDRHGLGALTDEMLELFYERRFAHSRPFDGVLPVLAALRERYVLGYATNGNSLAGRCGLGGEFAFELYAFGPEDLPKKPDPRFFAGVAAAVGGPPASIVYVGDHIHHDVAASRAAGMRAVWFNPLGLASPPEVTPDAQVRDLAELPAVVEGLAR